MKKLRGVGWALLLVNGLVAGSAPASIGAESPEVAPGRPNAPEAAVSIRAAGRGHPWVNVNDGRVIPTRFPAGSRAAADLEKGIARPLALATADYDEDGVPDVVCAYATDEGGFLTVHRGNVDAIYQNAPEAQARRAAGKFIEAPFMPEAQSLEVPETPDFIAAGDFDADGHWDLVTAKRGGETLLLYPGDGRGGFGEAESIELPGLVTAMTAGEINRRDGLTDLVVGVEGMDGASVLIFEGPGGALRRPPERVAMPGPAIEFALARLARSMHIDLVIVTAQDVVIVHGRDRRLSHSQERRETVAAPVVERFAMPFTIVAMAAGDFDGDRKVDLAFLDESGSLHVTVVGDLAQVAAGKGRSPEQAPREVKALLSRVANGPRDVRLQRARVSSLPGDDLLLVHRSGRRIHLRLPQEKKVGRLPVWVPFDVEGEPVSILSMRLNADAQSDMVVLSEGPASLSTIDTEATTVFMVTNTNASGTGSLHAAMTAANSVVGSDVILFNIPGAGPHTIQDTTGLPSITENVVIDATTQPGFAGSPIVEIDSSLSPASNGITVIAANTAIRGLVINGSGGHGIFLTPGDDAIIEGNFIGTNMAGTSSVGNTIAGIRSVFSTNIRIGGTTIAARNVISGNNAAGINVFDPSGLTIQGNYIGTDLTGTIAIANSGGILLQDTYMGTIGGIVAGGGNVISGNTGHGIEVSADSLSVLIQGNFVGTDASGSGALGNATAGIEILGSNITVGGTTPAARNLVSSNLVQGISVRSAGTSANTIVQGNYIGLDSSGTSVPGTPPFYGIDIMDSDVNLIGGNSVAARNIISGAQGVGIGLSGSSFGNDILANYIGTTAAGDGAVGNGACGVFIDGSSGNRIGGVGAFANVISGNASGVCIWNAGATGNLVDANLIGTDPTGLIALGNTSSGIDIRGASGNFIGVQRGRANVIVGSTIGVEIRGGSSGNSVQGNLIGLDITGLNALPNGSGVSITGGSGNVIGGDSSSEGNIISGNTGDGVLINGSDGNAVKANIIGMDSTGAISMGNGGAGVRLINDASSNTVGGGLATSNLIAFNGLDGVQVESGVSNAIRANSMFANGGLGIDLQADGVTANDSLDPDVGPNTLQNFPVVSAVTTTGGLVAFEVALNSVPSAMFSVDLYHDPLCDSSGHGEGRTYLASVGLPTDAAGNGFLIGSWPTSVPAGEFLTATITDSMGNTSEFSTCSAAAGVAPLALEGVIWDLADGPRIMWEESPGADSYNIYVGGLSNLAHLSDTQPDSCRQTAVEGATFFDIPVTQTPPAGQALWWLILPQGLYGEGDAGDGAAGPREHDSIGLCGSSCAHDKGVTGVALESACDPCVSMICAADPFCCDSNWDGQCVQEVRSVCESLTTAESQGTCQHTLCTTGQALQTKCDSPPVSPSCVEAICDQDAFCCTNSWDNLCVDQVTTVCHQGCL